MATITLKNLPDGIHGRVKALARGHHRSINSEIIFLLEQATGGETHSVDSVRQPRGMRERPEEYRSSAANPKGVWHEEKPIAAWLAELALINEFEGEMDPVVRSDRDQPEWE